MQELAARIGVASYVDVCCDLLAGAPREEYVEELRALTGFAWRPGDAVFDRSRWREYWVRTWGARGLLHVWDDGASAAVAQGVADEHHRPAEMCLKVAAAHEVAGCAPGALRLVDHSMARVRVAAVQCLAVVGDVADVVAVRERLGDVDVEVRRQAERAVAAMEQRLDL
jgi:hypothetical protein